MTSSIVNFPPIKRYNNLKQYKLLKELYSIFVIRPALIKEYITKMNAIMLELETEGTLCHELLAANRIIWDKDQHIRSFYTIPGNYSSYRCIHFVAVPVLFASYEKLVSIMKPHGLKVINSEQFSMVYNLESYQTFTKDVYEGLYEPNTSYILSQPKDLLKHYKDVSSGLPYLYRYNLRDLAFSFCVKDQHKYRQQALLNRLRTKIQEKISSLPIAEEVAVYMETMGRIFTKEEWEAIHPIGKEEETKEAVIEEVKIETKTEPEIPREATEEEVYQITRKYVKENQSKASKDVKQAIREGLFKEINRALNKILVEVETEDLVIAPEGAIRAILDELQIITPGKKIMKSLKDRVVAKLTV